MIIKTKSRFARQHGWSTSLVAVMVAHSDYANLFDIYLILTRLIRHNGACRG